MLETIDGGIQAAGEPVLHGEEAVQGGEGVGCYLVDLRVKVARSHQRAGAVERALSGQERRTTRFHHRGDSPASHGADRD
ncbi:hypothetical protein ACWEAF_34925 [Streptomyces sp. NPDC005071]